MKATDRSGVLRIADARAKIPGPNGERGVNLFARGTLNLRVNMLLPPNDKATHELDELYIVLKGQGTFVHGGKSERIVEGDLLFIAAGVEHYFDDFQELTLWRIYYGPKGGEIPA